jgi:hypothetical protein
MAITLGATLGWALNYLIFNYSSWLMKHPLTNEFLTSLAFTTPINAQATARLPYFSGIHLQKNLDGGWVEILGGQGSLLSSQLSSSKLTLSIGKSLASNLFIFTIFAITLFLLLLRIA